MKREREKEHTIFQNIQNVLKSSGHFLSNSAINNYNIPLSTHFTESLDTGYVCTAFFHISSAWLGRKLKGSVQRKVTCRLFHRVFQEQLSNFSPRL